MKGLKVVNFIPDTLDNFHINRAPRVIPVTLNKIGVDTVTFATGNDLPKRPDLPTNAILKKYNIGNSTSVAKQLRYVLELNEGIKREKPDVMTFNSKIATQTSRPKGIIYT